MYIINRNTNRSNDKNISININNNDSNSTSNNNDNIQKPAVAILKEFLTNPNLIIIPNS